MDPADPFALLPLGHPCAFARLYLEDPRVRFHLEQYRHLSARKAELTREKRFSDAWDVLLEMHALEAELHDHCARLRRQHEPAD